MAAKSLCVATSPQTFSQLDEKTLVEKLKPGDIILTRDPLEPIAWPIWWLTKSPWNHAEIYFGNNQSVGAHFNGIRMSTLAELNSWYGTKFCFLRPKIVTDMQQAQVSGLAWSLVGSGYDYWHLFQALWRIMLGTLGKAPLADDPGKFVCFEFAAYCWHRNGIEVGGKFADNATGKSFTSDDKLFNVFADVNK
jgi:hypothetical protein